MQPPTVAFKSFINSLEKVRESQDPMHPSELGRNTWAYSGGVISQLLQAYRFLGLADARNWPTEAFFDLVHPARVFSDAFGRIVRSAYSDLFVVDLSSVTPSGFFQMFEAYGLEGKSEERAISFFCHAAEAGNIPIAHSLRTKNRRGLDQLAKPAPPGGGIDDRATRTVNLRSGGAITLGVSIDAFKLSPQDRNFVFTIIDLLNEYESRRPKGVDAPPKAKEDLWSDEPPF